jgi:predicted ATP-dependent protease
MSAKILEAGSVGIPRFEFEIEPSPRVFALSSHHRAQEALALGLNRPGPQYNIYVLGPDQAGRLTATQQYVRSWASEYPPASDWLYLIDFEQPSTPKAVPVPAGTGIAIRDAVEGLVPNLAQALANAFSGEAYEQQVAQLKAGGEAELETRSRELEARAREKGLALIPTPQGPIIAALGEEGKPVAVQTLPEQMREELMSEGSEILTELAQINRDALRFRQRFLEAIEGLNKQVARLATNGLIEMAAQPFEGIEAINSWFTDLANDVVEHFQIFMHQNQPVPTPDLERALSRYSINLLVDRRHERHRPVVLEQNPTYESLFGRIEYRQLPGGGLETDVSLVRAGSLHRANGGVLILRAADVVGQPLVWTFLKAALRDGEVRIEEFYRAGAPPIAGAPKPGSIPLDLTVVLIGSPALYHMFFAADPEFSSYFKVKAHIESFIDATPLNLAHFAGLLASHAESHGSSLEPGAVKLLLGLASRWAAHRRRITTRFEALYSLIEEACDGCERIDENAIQRAREARRQRNSQIEDEVHRSIKEKLTIISVTGRAVGQVNGLTVQNVGDHVFGAPARITARASIGRQGVINIERLVAMSGPIQQKGSLVLQGLITRRFARHAPTSFDCSVTFEQLYGGVEGDSASLAEYIAIISDLADLPIRQDLAITGSVNQLGEAQVIGGAHHKIEGFFRVCADVGELTGEQGVVLPTGNEQHLVLREDVETAVADGRFHLFSIESVDDAVELFTGLPVGTAAEPSDETVYGRVVKTLNEFDRILADRRL